MRVNGSTVRRLRQERRDTFTTDDIDDYRRAAGLGSHSRTAQKVLVLHPALQARQVPQADRRQPVPGRRAHYAQDPGIFNILEPIEFEAVYRAVGETTFGKALVQSVYRLTRGAAALITTARYYTPSGRLIQRPWDGTFDDYLTYTLRDQDANKTHKAEDLKLTDAGRKVYSGGGIEPDRRV